MIKISYEGSNRITAKVYSDRQSENMHRWQEMESRKSGVKFQQPTSKFNINPDDIIDAEFEIIKPNIKRLEHK